MAPDLIDLMMDANMSIFVDNVMDTQMHDFVPGGGGQGGDKMMCCEPTHVSAQFGCRLSRIPSWLRRVPQKP